MVEPSVSLPKEKAFSVAAALPMPSFSSWTHSHGTNKEHLPFSQNEHSAHHIAQQLTLLQQVHATHTHTRTHRGLRLLFSTLTTRGRHITMSHDNRHARTLKWKKLCCNRRCSRDITQFISSTPEHKESRTKSGTIASKNDTSTASWLSCIVSYRAECNT